LFAGKTKKELAYKTSTKHMLGRYTKFIKYLFLERRALSGIPRAEAKTKVLNRLTKGGFTTIIDEAQFSEEKKISLHNGCLRGT